MDFSWMNNPPYFSWPGLESTTSHKMAKWLSHVMFVIQSFQMIARLKGEIQELKNQLSLTSEDQRTDILSAEDLER